MLEVFKRSFTIIRPQSACGAAYIEVNTLSKESSRLLLVVHTLVPNPITSGRSFTPLTIVFKVPYLFIGLCNYGISSVAPQQVAHYSGVARDCALVLFLKVKRQG